MSTPVLEPDEIARIERLALDPSRRVAGSAAGQHRSVTRGRSLDVVEWREYQPGDDPRTIDVQAWARLDQVLVRLYEADVDLRVQLIVDTSASMDLGDKLHHAGRVAAAIATAALVRNETVSLSTLDEIVPRRYRGRRAMPRLFDQIVAWRGSGPTRLVERARAHGATTRRGGLVVVVSDFLTPDALAAIDRFAARREQLVAVLVTCRADESPESFGEVQLVDAETGERVDVDLSPTVVDEFRVRRERARQELRDRVTRHGGSLVVTASEDDLLGDVVPALLAAGVLR